MTRRQLVHDQGATLCLYTVHMCSIVGGKSWHFPRCHPGRGGSYGTRGWLARMPSPHWSGCPDGVRVSCALSPCGVRTRTNAPGARVSLAMMAIRRTVRTVAVVDDVVRLALGMATGMIHGEVPARIVVPTRVPDYSILVSCWQIRPGTTRVQNDQKRMRKEGEAYGKFQ